MALVALDPLEQVDPLAGRDPSDPRDPLDPLADLLAARAGEPATAARAQGSTPAGRSSTSTASAPGLAVTGELERPLPAEIAARLGVDALWSHQARAIDLARAGRSVVVATGTASGKSLCYQVPIAEAAAAPVRRGTALLVFPTKALAHDQLRALSQRDFPGVVAGAYDGDTGNEERAWIRRHATVVLTNPEMLHSGVLPHHDRWATFLGRLRYVVVDELHVFRGHLRLARRPPAAPAAAAVPPLRRRPDVRVLLGHDRPARAAGRGAVRPAGGGRGRRRVAPGRAPGGGVEPPAARRGHRGTGVAQRRDGGAGRRAGALGPEDHRLLPRPAGHRGGGGRRAAPAAVAPAPPGRRPTGAATWPRSAGPSRTSSSAGASTAWSPPARSSWASTSAASTPWCSTASRARSPRSGSRRGGPAASGQPSAAVLVAGSDQLDQWMAAHPAELVEPPARAGGRQPRQPVRGRRPPALRRPREAADARRRALLARPARRRRAAPGPRRPGGGARAGSRAGARRRCTRAAGGRRTASGCASARAARWRCARRTARRSAPSSWRGRCEQAHPGASYLHAGQSWRVVDLDLDGRTAIVEPDDGGTYTVARTDVDIRVTGCDARRRGRRAGGGAGRRRGAPAGDRLPAQGRHHGRVAGRRAARPAAVDADHPGVLVPRARGAARRGRRRPARRPRSPARRRARRHRRAAAVHDLRPLGRRRRVDAAPARHRRPGDRHLRRLPGRRRRGRAGLRGGRAPRAHDGRRDRGVPVPRRAARRACSRPSAATATTRSTRRGRWPCSTRSGPDGGADRRHGAAVIAPPASSPRTAGRRRRRWPISGRRSGTR